MQWIYKKNSQYSWNIILQKEKHSSVGGSLLAEEQNFTNIYQEKLTIKQISKLALPLDKRNTNAAALLILFSQLADFRRAAQRNGYCC